jgi:hypothetical protein
VQVVGVIAVFSIDNVISGTYAQRTAPNDLHRLQILNDFAPCPFGAESVPCNPVKPLLYFRRFYNCLFCLPSSPRQNAKRKTLKFRAVMGFAANTARVSASYRRAGSNRVPPDRQCFCVVMQLLETIGGATA